MDLRGTRAWMLGLAGAVVLAVGGCGGSDNDGSGASGDSGEFQASGEEEEVLEVYERFGQASVDRDTEAFCDLIDEESIRALERLGGCTSVFTEDTFSGTEEGLENTQVTDVEISGDEAAVATELEGTEDTLDFVREDGEWHIVLERTGFLE